MIRSHWVTQNVIGVDFFAEMKFFTQYSLFSNVYVIQ